MRKLFLFLIIIFSGTTKIAGQSLTDSTIMMTAFWEIGDEVIYDFKHTVDKFSEGEKTLEESTYEVQINVIDSTENHYTLEWRYGNEQSNQEVSELEKEFLKLSQNIPVRFTTDEFGSFREINNWKEMKELVEQTVDNWLKEKKEVPDSLKIPFKNMVTSLFQTSAQASYWANDLKFFHQLYGINLPRQRTVNGIRFYTNPFIKEVMPGFQKIKVLVVDEENYIAKIKLEAGIDGLEAKKLMIDFVKKNLESFGLKDEEEINPDDIPDFSTREEINCVYDIGTGYILKGTYIKHIKVDGDYKKHTYEYKLQK